MESVSRLLSPSQSLCANFICSDPFHLVSSNYIYWMFGALIILNILNVVELYRLYDQEDFNAAYECTFEEGLLDGMIAEECVVYFELMGACTAVFLSMLFINVAVCRAPKPAVNKLKEFGEGQEYSLRDLQTLADDSDDNGVKTYYKYAIDVIKEVRESEAPAFMPNAWFEWKCCRKNCDCGCWLPSVQMLVYTVLMVIFIGFLTLVSLYTHPDAYLNAMQANWEHIASVVISYLVVVVFLFNLVLVMWEISMMFRKAYALMKISSNPMDFIGNSSEDSAAAQGVQAQSAAQADAGQPDGAQVDADQPDADPASSHYLNKRMNIVNPEFLRAWSSLREHIQRWELEYFYEVCSHRIHIILHFNTVGDICTRQLQV